MSDEPITLWLLAMHMVGDYIAQNHQTSQRKLISVRTRLYHVATYTLCFAAVPLIRGMGWIEALLFLLSIAVPHFVIDSRRWASGKDWNLKPLAVDQTLHVCCLAATATLFQL